MHTRLPVIQDNQNADLCTPCGGKCCKSIPGIYWPEDFGSDRDEVIANVRAAIATGKTTLDYWESVTSDDMYYPRPAVKGMEGASVDPSEGGECTHLTATGCALTWTQRPTQCRALEPKPGRGYWVHAGRVSDSLSRACEAPPAYATKLAAATAWQGYDLFAVAADE